MGVDSSPTAIARAQEKARARGRSVVFRVADALDLARIRRRFETAVDCGLFHVFERPERRAYAQSLTEVLSPRLESRRPGGAARAWLATLTRI